LKEEHCRHVISWIDTQYIEEFESCGVRRFKKTINIFKKIKTTDHLLEWTLQHLMEHVCMLMVHKI
jgi:hypothetical protein